MEIRLSIRKSLDCPLSFFEGYGLQVTLVLDTKHARDIVAEGATLANVGSKKQITYTLLPNRAEAPLSISRLCRPSDRSHA